VEADDIELLNKRKLPTQKSIIVISAIITVVCLAASAWLIYDNSHHGTTTLNKIASSPKSTVSATSTPKPTTPNASVLVFQSNIGTQSVTTSLVGLDGTTRLSFLSDPSSATYYSSFFSQQRGLLIEGDRLLATNKAYTSLSLLLPDGSKKAVSDKLTYPLTTHERSSPSSRANPTHFLSYGIVSGDELFAVDTDVKHGELDYVKINLITGATTTLLTAESTFIPQNGNPVFDELVPSTISQDGSVMYLLAVDANINTVEVSGESLVSLNLSTGKFTTKPLPQGDYYGAAVSKDGNLVTYQTLVSSGLQNHIYNFSTGKDAILPGKGMGLTHNDPTNVSFSPDGAYLVEIGGYKPATLQVFSAEKSALVRQVDFEARPKDYQIQMSGIGWTGDHTFVYTTNSSPSGDFNPEQADVHSIDASTGRIFDFPAGLGELESVLNYRK
jgi:hypothetical protein